jgi:hypothetical protein
VEMDGGHRKSRRDVHLILQRSWGAHRLTRHDTSPLSSIAPIARARDHLTQGIFHARRTAIKYLRHAGHCQSPSMEGRQHPGSHRGRHRHSRQRCHDLCEYRDHWLLALCPIAYRSVPGLYRNVRVKSGAPGLEIVLLIAERRRPRNRPGPWSGVGRASFEAEKSTLDDQTWGE